MSLSSTIVWLDSHRGCVLHLCPGRITHIAERRSPKNGLRHKDQLLAAAQSIESKALRSQAYIAACRYVL